MKYDVRKLRSRVHEKKIDLKYLTSYNGWKTKELTKLDWKNKSLEEKLEKLDDLNENGLDIMVSAKDELEGYQEQFKTEFDKFVTMNEPDATAMSSQRHRLEDILGEGHYIDGYSLMKEMMRRYVLVLLFNIEQ